MPHKLRQPAGGDSVAHVKQTPVKKTNGKSQGVAKGETIVVAVLSNVNPPAHAYGHGDSASVTRDHVPMVSS